MKTRKKLYHILKYNRCGVYRLSLIIGRSIPVTFMKLLGVLEFTASDIENISRMFSREVAAYIFFCL